MAVNWDDYDRDAEIQHWYIYLEKEPYSNEDALKHSSETDSKEFFISICRKIDDFLKKEFEISDICWTPTTDILEEFKLFAEICPNEN